MKILFVDACVRKESRTRKLARHVLERMNGTVTEVNAASATKAITDESFILARTDASERKKFSDPVFCGKRWRKENGHDRQQTGDRCSHGRSRRNRA